jgi:hypothetical protein
VYLDAGLVDKTFLDRDIAGTVRDLLAGLDTIQREYDHKEVSSFLKFTSDLRLADQLLGAERIPR